MLSWTSSLSSKIGFLTGSSSSSLQSRIAWRTLTSNIFSQDGSHQVCYCCRSYHHPAWPGNHDWIGNIPSIQKSSLDLCRRLTIETPAVENMFGSLLLFLPIPPSLSKRKKMSLMIERLSYSNLLAGVAR